VGPAVVGSNVGTGSVGAGDVLGAEEGVEEGEGNGMEDGRCDSSDVGWSDGIIDGNIDNDGLNEGATDGDSEGDNDVVIVSKVGSNVVTGSVGAGDVLGAEEGALGFDETLGFSLGRSDSDGDDETLGCSLGRSDSDGDDDTLGAVLGDKGVSESLPIRALTVPIE